VILAHLRIGAGSNAAITMSRFDIVHDHSTDSLPDPNSAKGALPGQSPGAGFP